MIEIDEYDDDVVSSEFILLLLMALLATFLWLVALLGAAVFIATGSFPCLLGALLLGNELARARG